MPSDNAGIRAVKTVQNFRRQSAAVVRDIDQQVMTLFLGIELDIAVLAVAHTVNNGVLDQRLKYKLRHNTVLKLLGNVDFAGKAVLKAQGLDVDLAFQKIQFLLQCIQLAAGNARAQDGSEVGGEHGNLRDVAGNRHPFHRVQRVI